jgi:hypothetical protein
MSGVRETFTDESFVGSYPVAAAIDRQATCSDFTLLPDALQQYKPGDRCNSARH